MDNILRNKNAYKAFRVDKDNNLYCTAGGNTKYYKVGEEATQHGELKMCSNGIHFCWELNDINYYYYIIGDSIVIGEIEILGDVINEPDMKKSCTNKIKLIKLLTKEEVLKISNSGANNSGVINSGNWNSGNWNSGNWNSGDCNGGNWNSGNWNSGSWNGGNWNSGNWNSGSWNSGDCNSGNFSFGCFNTKSSTINLFNKSSNMTLQEWRNSRYCDAILSSRFTLTDWIYYTDKEKENDKAKKLIGGYLKTYSYKEACQNWWQNLSQQDKDVVMNIPNFDKDIFFNITGIDVK